MSSAHDIEPCLPPNCPPDGDPAWCIYEILNIVGGDPVVCKQRGIILDLFICVTPCPFPGDPVDCDPHGTGIVRFRTANGCVFDAISLGGCEICPPNTAKWSRLP